MLPESSVVLFIFDMGSVRVELSVRSMVPLNDGHWHRVEAEKNIKETWLQLDGQYREVRSSSQQGHTKSEFYSDLYVGKIPARCVFQFCHMLWNAV